MKLMWTEKIENHTFIFWRGIPIWKRWDTKDGKHCLQIIWDLHNVFYFRDGRDGVWPS